MSGTGIQANPPRAAAAIGLIAAYVVILLVGFVVWVFVN